MELELKHLSAYLPYGLKMRVIDNFYNYDIMTLCDKSGLSNIGIAEVIDEKQDFKPLLYPKSHLYKLQDEMVARWGQGLSGKSLEYWKQTLTAEMMQDDYNSIRYDFVRFMLENNIDVFGLIPAGLAEEIK